MKEVPKNPSGDKEEICAHCGKKFDESAYGALTRYILGKHKPACSYECNKALGQAK